MKVELKNYTSLKSICDWIELCVAINGEITKAEVDHFLNNNDYSGNQENYINSMWKELKIRNRRYNDVTPMEIDDISVLSVFNWKECPEYVLMLILSLEGNGWNTQDTALIFERICKEVLEEYIGGKAKVVGFPQKVSVKEICEDIEEDFIQELPARYKDRKLDVVGWKKIDSRRNKLMILMQCAAGNNWRGKTTELQPEVWRDYIRFACRPTRAFGFVHVVDDELFFETGKEGGIVFDRLRIFRYLVNKDKILDSSLRDDVIKWCNERLILMAS
jgi:hypothetical protein